MSWPGFLFPMGGWLALLALPLVMLYFLKLRRRRVEVPSLVLWRQVLADHRVNAPFQRFRRHLLLWLQLLLLGLLVLALSQPYVEGGAGALERVVVLIDRSASMGAVMGGRAETRIEEAKERATEMVENLMGDQEVSLIAFDNGAERLSGFTSNRQVLRTAIERIEVREVEGDIREAMQLAKAMALAEPIDRVVVLSDGNLPGQVAAALPFAVDFQRLSGARANLGITDLSARRSGRGQWDVLVRVAGSSDEAAGGKLGVYENGELGGEQFVSVTRDRPQRVMFRLSTEERTRVRVQITPESEDSLTVDNVGWLVLEAPRPLAVMVRGQAESMRRALEGIEDVEMASDGPVDLLVSGGMLAQDVEAGVHLVIGRVPPELADLVTIERGQTTTVSDWLRHDRLLEHVSFDDVFFLNSPRLADGAQTADMERRGFDVLVWGNAGPLLLYQPGAQPTYWLLVDPEASTLVYRVGFPILTANLVRLAMERAGLLDVEAGTTGVSGLTGSVAADERYTVDGPGDLQQVVRSDGSGRLGRFAAPRAGAYQVRGAGVDQTVYASLLSRQETQLGGVDRLSFESFTASAEMGTARTDRPLWRWVAIGALVVLVVEWWVFQRRPGGYPSWR